MSSCPRYLYVLQICQGKKESPRKLDGHLSPNFNTGLTSLLPSTYTCPLRLNVRSPRLQFFLCNVMSNLAVILFRGVIYITDVLLSNCKPQCFHTVDTADNFEVHQLVNTVSFNV